MVRLWRVVCVVAVAFAVVVPSPSLSQRRPRRHRTVRRAPEDSARQEALALFQEGVASFRARNYPTALAIFERAFRRFPEPVLLLNMARTLEHLDRDDEALRRYQEYLATSGAQERALAEERVAALRPPPARVHAPSLSDDPPQGELASGEPVPDRTAAAPARNQHVSTGADPAPWIVFTLGALALGAGIVTALISQEQMQNAGIAESQVATRDQTQRALDLATISNLLMFGGGGIVVFGAIWGFATLGGSSEEPVRAQLELGVGSLTLRGAF